MILPFIKELESIKDIKKNILEDSEVQKEAESLNTPVDDSLEKNLLQTPEETQKEKTEKEKIEIESLKWKRADKGK